MNTEFITNGDDDEVHVPKVQYITIDEILNRYEESMNEEQKQMLKEMANAGATKLWWFGAKAYEEFNKVFEEEAKKVIIEKPASNKEYSDKMKKYLEERSKK